MGAGLPLAALAAAMLTSALGVTRMRSWGVLLGMATSIVTVAGALLSGNENVALALALAAVPGILLASPLVAARLSRARGARPLATAPAALDVAPTARVRIATGAGDEEVAADVELHEVAPASAGTR